MYFFFFFQAEDGIRDIGVTGVQTCALPILGICVAGACLTTAIGLVATVADYFSKISSLSYEKLAVLTTVISFIFACFGVDMIVKISVPVLVFLYPLAMALILLNVFKIQNH